MDEYILTFIKEMTFNELLKLMKEIIKELEDRN